MNEWIIAGICFGVFIILVIIQKIMHSKRPVRTAVISMLWGIIALVAVNICSSFTGVSIPVSPMTLSVSAVLGIPGVTCLLLMQRIL